MSEAVRPDDGYPEDWREQGRCCRECAVMAWRLAQAVGLAGAYGTTAGALPDGAAEEALL
jgi:hypothetical protein